MSRFAYGVAIAVPACGRNRGQTPIFNWMTRKMVAVELVKKPPGAGLFTVGGITLQSVEGRG